MDRRRFDDNSNNGNFNGGDPFQQGFNNVPPQQPNQFDRQFNSQGFVPPQPTPIRRSNYQQPVQFGNAPMPGYPQQPVQRPMNNPVPTQQPNQFPYPNQQEQFQTVFPGNQFVNPNEVDLDLNQNYNQMPNMGDNQKKKKGLFSFMNKKDEQEAPKSMNNVVIVYPKAISEVATIIDGLRKGQAIIVDLHKIDPQSCQRALDYLSGALYALCGSQQVISESMFLFTPAGVCIQGPTDLKNRFN